MQGRFRRMDLPAIILFVILLLFVPKDAGTVSHEVRKGELDLSGWQPYRDGPIRLDGEWEFYWRALLNQEDLASRPRRLRRTFFPVPGIWNRSGKRFDPPNGEGYATYRMMIRNVPSDIAECCLKIPDMPTAYRLWVDDTLIAENGVVGRNRETMRPWFSPKVVHFPIQRDHVTFILQVSNYFHRDGGIWHSLELGTEKDCFRMETLPLLFDTVLFGGLLIMGMYHIGLFALRPQDKAPLYFGLFCLVIGGRSLLVGQRIVYLIFPSLDFLMLQRFEFVLLFLGAPVFCLFFYHLFPSTVSRLFHRIVGIVNLLFIGAVVLFPLHIFAYTGDMFQLSMIPICIYMIIAVKNVTRAGIVGGWLFAGGFIMLLLTVINDTLYTQMLIRSRPLAHLGVFMFIFFQAFLLSKKFAATFQKVAVMTNELTLKNKALLRVDILKDEFLANTSHELKTPLHGIMGIAESMVHGATGPLTVVQRQNLDMIAGSGKRLFNLINDLLDFSKMRKSELRLNLRPVDLDSMADLVLAFSKSLVYKKPISLRKEIAPNVSAVIADEDRLQQILFNLVGNAVKYTPSGEVVIKAEQMGVDVFVSVADTGIGIAEKDQQRIFEDFEQVDGGVERSYPGTGLGLAISQKLVKLHGSSITLKSEPGKGSTFSFTLQAATQNVTDESAQNILVRSQLMDDELLQASPQIEIENQVVIDNPLSAAVASDNRTILVVDDEPVNLQLIYNQLKFNGYRVLSAQDGFEALEIVTEEKPDAVLLDIMMPRMSGFEVCRKMRADHDFYSLPIIMLTAKNRLADLIQGLESGANDYLTKPFHRTELLARLNTHLQAKESMQRLKQNVHLQAEIHRRKQIENELRISQRRLVRILDSANNAIVVMNQTGAVIFFNQGAERRFGYSVNEALQQTYETLLMESSAAVIRHCMETRGQKTKKNGMAPLRRHLMVTGRKSDGTLFETVLFLSSFEIGESCYYTMIFKADEVYAELTAPNENGLPQAAHATALGNAFVTISDYIDGTRNEDAVSLRTIDSSLDGIGERLHVAKEGADLRGLLVDIMNLSLKTWETKTGKNKVALAEESKIWKAYLDGSTWKTRTLDKYLSLKSLPQNPRWREVLRTANYVLACCPLSEMEKTEIVGLIRETERLLSEGMA